MDQRNDTTNQTKQVEGTYVRHTLQQVCQKCFHGSRQMMASVLEVRIKDLNRPLDTDGVRIGVAIFDKAANYCRQNKVSIDGIIRDEDTESETNHHEDSESISND